MGVVKQRSRPMRAILFALILATLFGNFFMKFATAGEREAYCADVAPCRAYCANNGNQPTCVSICNGRQRLCNTSEAQIPGVRAGLCRALHENSCYQFCKTNRSDTAERYRLCENECDRRVRACQTTSTKEYAPKK